MVCLPVWRISSLGTRHSFTTEGSSGLGKSPATPAAKYQRDGPHKRCFRNLEVLIKRLEVCDLDVGRERKR